MSGERWQRVDEIFNQAASLPPMERGQYVAAACRDDEEMRREVESLLAHDRSEHKVMELAIEQAAENLAQDGLRSHDLIGTQVGSYLITALIGEGGMGRVFQARDTRLNRAVAIKTLAADYLADSERNKRFLREAKSASALNHPNIVTIYALIEHRGTTFIVMEYISGRTLDSLIPRNGLPSEQTVKYGCEIADALAAAHAAGILHRDIKPSNIMVTEQGRVKILDFGLAKAARGGQDAGGVTVTAEALKTMDGAVFGTPAYMSPEQARGEPVDARTDLFSLGVVLYQMSTGTLPFKGDNPAAILDSIVRETPDAAETVNPRLPRGLQAIITKALEKNRDRRYSSAAQLYSDLKRLTSGTYSREGKTLLKAKESSGYENLGEGSESHSETGAPQAIRFLAFPFRADTVGERADYLVYGLPEAIGSSLAELNVFTVRSTQMAMRFDPMRWDPKTVGVEADVDVILTGTLTQRTGSVHAVTQLLEAASGTVIWSKAWDLDLQDVFRFVQGVMQLIVRTLVRARDQRVRMTGGVDKPANHEAYELYLRANQLLLMRTPENMTLARDLYIASTEKDSNYAPAWAQLGRCYRFLTKFGTETIRNFGAARVAFERAFALNPDLGLAHNLYTPLEVDLGGAEAAMMRLLKRASAHQNEAELFSGLVHACRYCGQLEASVAAHERVLSLDKNAHTSVAHTYFVMGDYERALYWYGTGAGLYLDALALTCMGRRSEAEALLWTRKDRFHLMPIQMNSLRAYLEGDYTGGIAVLRTHSDLSDPELRFYMARQAAAFGAVDLANQLLARSAQEGYFSSVAVTRDPWLQPLRSTPEYGRTLAIVKTREAHARAAFRDAGGERICAYEGAANTAGDRRPE